MSSPFLTPVRDWYAQHARDLPWRRPSASPWSVYVSEVMLQQTPVARVLPAHAAWLERWPSPAALAAATPADAVRQWDRLGYPRRALRLHASAVQMTDRHGGSVPESAADLLALPGVGPYTAAAVASFAFGARHAVMDVNVRRVLARLVTAQFLPGPSPTAAELALAQSLLPADGRAAAAWSVGVMELGALVCTSGRPKCEECPLAGQCAWIRAGRPAGQVRRRSPGYEGTDRQCRGALLAVMRATGGPVPGPELAAAWPDGVQRERALASLLGDGLAVRSPRGVGLPGDDPERH